MIAKKLGAGDVMEDEVLSVSILWIAQTYRCYGSFV